jgi:hypothetical protein
VGGVGGARRALLVRELLGPAGAGGSGVRRRCSDGRRRLCQVTCGVGESVRLGLTTVRLKRLSGRCKYDEVLIATDHYSIPEHAEHQHFFRKSAGTSM